MFCKIKDLNLYYEIYNNGNIVKDGILHADKPVLIMLHGGPGLNDHTVYVPFWSLFSDISQVVFIDMRGHGKSIAEQENSDKWNLKQWGSDLKDFCDTVGIVKPIVAGFSFGGWVALSYLTQFPNHPGKVILCNTEAFIDIEKRVNAYNKKDESGEAGRIVRQLKEMRGNPQTVKLYVEKLSPFFGAKSHYMDNATSKCIMNHAVWNKFDRDEYYDFDFREKLKQLDFPAELQVLAIAGDKDPEHPWECAKETIECIGKKNAFLYLVKDAGDPVERDCPEEMLDVIKKFIIAGNAGIKSIEEQILTNEIIEEYLLISDDNKLVQNRTFNNLDWAQKNFKEIIFKNCIIRNSNFFNANLYRLRLENCKIFNCNFEKAIIEDGFFEDCLFYEKEHQIGCNFSLADLNRTEFHRCNISMNNFKRANVFQIVINDCRAQGCNFKFANFVNVVSRNVLFSSAFLTKTDFRYSNFEGVYLKKCDLSESKFVSVCFTKTNLEEADLTNTEFSPSEYTGLSIINADFRNAEIRNIDVRKLDFSGIKIFEWQQEFFIENLGIITYPDKRNHR